MTKFKKLFVVLLMVTGLVFTSCGTDQTKGSKEQEEPAKTDKNEEPEKEKQTMKREIYYQGHGSLRITTSSGFTAYIDPFAGDGYDQPADLILVTHQHSDHNKTDLPARKENCRVWQNMDALADGEYKTETIGDITIKAVEAYNSNHPKSQCVGYILSFDGIKVYVAGDTSTTEQMKTMPEEKLDYVFLPIDGVYNMDPAEATECAKLIQAKTSIPYHMAPSKLFDQKKAEQFNGPNRLIVPAGESVRY